MLGTFVALDLVLFFVVFEIVLVPMYFLIAVWGGEGRQPAGTKFILYTVLGSVVMLLGFLVIYAQTGTFDMIELADRGGEGIARGIQIAAFLAIGIGFAVKTPLWPLHTWLPDAHTAAPTVGSVLLAGVLLKMGTYGFVRIALPVLPDGARAIAPALGVLAVIGIVYGSLACLAQHDLKRLIAYSSVGHMGFVVLGIATLTVPGINGALFANVAHGLITGLLFFLAGAVKDRHGTADMVTSVAVSMRVPRLAALLAFAAVASLGLPGLAGFWGEMLAMLGAFRPDASLDRPLFLVLMVVAGLGTVLTAAYLLQMVRRVNQGISDERWTQPRMVDVTGTEWSAWTPLVIATIVVAVPVAAARDHRSRGASHRRRCRMSVQSIDFAAITPPLVVALITPLYVLDLLLPDARRAVTARAAIRCLACIAAVAALADLGQRRCPGRPMNVPPPSMTSCCSSRSDLGGALVVVLIAATGVPGNAGATR